MTDMLSPASTTKSSGRTEVTSKAGYAPVGSVAGYAKTPGRDGPRPGVFVCLLSAVCCPLVA
ncbi:hypothetical protein ACFCZ1_04475 [Streptomyces sp. NPDC056224]|uniref:hypothetical protein n=1 Tax=Streptomyces sp. NPDC056224 TaxID=3345750 RepID=UPI0035D9EF3A